MNTANNYPFTIHRRSPGMDDAYLKDRQTFRIVQKASIRLLPDIGFTDREIDILKLMAVGNTSAEIAEELYLSPHTIKTHQKNLLKKTGCRNSTHLVVSCLKSKLI